MDCQRMKDYTYTILYQVIYIVFSTYKSKCRGFFSVLLPGKLRHKEIKGFVQGNIIPQDLNSNLQWKGQFWKWTSSKWKKIQSKLAEKLKVLDLKYAVVSSICERKVQGNKYCRALTYLHIFLLHLCSTMKAVMINIPDSVWKKEMAKTLPRTPSSVIY